MNQSDGVGAYTALESALQSARKSVQETESLMRALEMSQNRILQMEKEFNMAIEGFSRLLKSEKVRSDQAVMAEVVDSYMDLKVGILNFYEKLKKNSEDLQNDHALNQAIQKISSKKRKLKSTRRTSQAAV